MDSEGGSATFLACPPPGKRTALKTLRSACVCEPEGRCSPPAGVRAYFEEYLAETRRPLFNSEERSERILQAPEEYGEVGRDKSGVALGTRMARCCGIRCEVVNDGRGSYFLAETRSHGHLPLATATA